MERSLIAGKIRMLVIMLLFVVHACQQDEVERPEDEPVFDVDTGNSEIPYLVIETRGLGILNEPKIPADLSIYVQKAEIQSARIGIEFRGSTSYRLSDKKSYGIETWDQDGNDVDATFFDFPEEEDFILLGHIVNLDNKYVFDPTLIYNLFGYNLFRKMGHYASRTKIVELEINGDYKGVYIFLEKLKRDKNRIDIKKLEPADTDSTAITGGYILKIDKTAGGDLNIDQPLEYFETNWADDARYTSGISFRSNYDIYGNLIDFEAFGEPYHSQQYLETYFLYEYPKAEQITEVQKTYIQNYIHDFETALLTDDFSGDQRSYTDYIDLESFVDYFILNEICRNIDGYRLSTYMYKDRGGLLKMGPVWDLNIGFFTAGRVPVDDWVINYNTYVSGDPWMMPFWWPRLMEDPRFRDLVKSRWAEMRSTVLSLSEMQWMVDMAASRLRDNGAVERNYNLWDQGIGIDWESSIGSLKSYLEDRVQWMDGEISAL
ncbi:MAG: CotH kinase family protein [Bacteroidota bacterium]